MQGLYNSILRIAISVGLSDREAFVDKVAELLDRSIGSDPDAARDIGANIAVWLESLKDELLVRQMFASQRREAGAEEAGREVSAAGNEELIREIARLRESIESLNRNLKKK